MPIITLTTDFGLKDGFVGTMKGVILSICPEARLVDISNDIAPQNILEGALVLDRAYSYFPAGTIHLAVVDPGVGTERHPIAARLGNFYFVGPDNGLFTPILEKMEKQGRIIEFVQLTHPNYRLPQVSKTFHGRDIFAPSAAHLAKGVPLSDFGPVLHHPVRLALPYPEKTEIGWHAHILGIDHFGNLATDLPGLEIVDKGEILIRLHGKEIHGMVDSFGQKPAGELVALINSAGYLEVAIVNGSAAALLSASVGETLEVYQIN